MMGSDNYCLEWILDTTLEPERLAEAVSKLQVFTVQKAMVTEEQEVALKELPGMLNIANFSNLYFHFHSRSTETCSPACSHHKAVMADM